MKFWSFKFKNKSKMISIDTQTDEKLNQIEQVKQIKQTEQILTFSVYAQTDLASCSCHSRNTLDSAIDIPIQPKMVLDPQSDSDQSNHSNMDYSFKPFDKLHTIEDDDKPLIAVMSPVSAERGADYYMKKTPIFKLQSTELKRSKSARQSGNLMTQIDLKTKENNLSRSNSVRHSQQKYKKSLNRQSIQESYLSPDKTDFIRSWARNSVYN